MPAMNLKVLLLLLGLSFLTVFALVYVLLTRQGSFSQSPRCPSIPPRIHPWTHPSQSQLFADLTPEELTAVMSFLTKHLGPGLVDAAQARPSDNCVFSVELQLPAKAAALAHLDRGGPPPVREALAIIFFGGQPKPNVSELVVGPLPHPSYMRDVTVERHGGPLPYYRRPMQKTEFVQIWRHLKEVELPKAPTFLASVLNYNGSTLAPLHSTASGFHAGDRATWIALYHNISGLGVFLHPVGLELLLDHGALDPADWVVQQVFYLGHYYADLAQLEWEFKVGRLEVIRVPLPTPGGASSLRPRVTPDPPLPPLQFSLQGPQYNIQGNSVTSPLWTFTFGHGVFSGLRIFDIRFKGERVAYEVSVQECLTVYGADSPKTRRSGTWTAAMGLVSTAELWFGGWIAPIKPQWWTSMYWWARGQSSCFQGLCVYLRRPRDCPFEGIIMASGVISMVVWPAQALWSGRCHQWATMITSGTLCYTQPGPLKLVSMPRAISTQPS